MNDRFTMLCNETMPDEPRNREVYTACDFQTLSTAIRAATAHRTRRPASTVEIWLNKLTLIWESNPNRWNDFERTVWTGPAAPGTYEAVWKDEHTFDLPTFRLLTRSHAKDQGARP